MHQSINYPEIGDRESYLLFHEELESLVKHIPEIKRARFWMTFGQAYLTHLQVLQDVGMTASILSVLMAWISFLLNSEKLFYQNLVL